MFKLLSNLKLNENSLIDLDLDELARNGAKILLAEALRLEVSEYLERNTARDKDGKSLVVRNGFGKERKVTIGSGTINLRAPRVNDRRSGNKFVSKILPPYLRRSPSINSVLPLLYLKGLSGNSFTDALKDLLGEDASGLSASSISSLKKTWSSELDEWKKREINEKYVYLWADGVNVSIRLGEDKKICLLVVMGVSESGEKHLLAVEAGYRESKDSWKFVFNNLISRGLKPPMLIIGDGGLGLWAAISEIEDFSKVKVQRCWVHKIANVLDKLPKRLHPQVKSLLHEMMNAPKIKAAKQSFNTFKKTLNDKYPKAVKCLEKDWDKMNQFFKFPAKHWPHIKTSNPIESAFATVKLRTKSTKGAGNAEMAKIMAFKLLREAEKKWRKIRGSNEIIKILAGNFYEDGVLLDNNLDNKAVA